MSSQSAIVIDLQSYRASRGAGRTTAPDRAPASLPADTPVVAWVPVWFMPVMVFGLPMTVD